MKNIILFLMLLQFCSCQRDADCNVNELTSEGIILAKWRVIGPFKSKEETSPLQWDFFEEQNFTEASIRYGDLPEIAPTDTSLAFKNMVADSEDHKLDFNRVFGYTESNTIKGVAYAGCRIESNKDQRLKLNLSANDGVKVWLNNKHIFTDSTGGDIKLYKNLIDIKLKEGENFLLMKVNNVRTKWAMFAAIEKPTKENAELFKRDFKLQWGNLYLSRNIIENDTLKLTWGIPDGTYKLEVKGPKTAEFDIKPNQIINLSGFPDGLYTTQLYTRGDTFSSRFCKVKDIKQTIKRLGRKIRNSPFYEKDKTVDALIFRYKHLLKPENLPKESFGKRSWDKRILFVYENLLARLEILNRKVSEGDVTGSLLRSYVSKIDDGPQYYLLHVPDNYQKNNPVPLVIEMSKLMKRFPSPLQTNRFANISLIEQFYDLANKYNMIILEPGNRTVDKSNYNNIDEADLWEALENVKRVYNIDTGRIYIRGSCRASYDAIRLAVKYPDKFAAISTVSPEFVSPHRESNLWLHQNDPLNFLKNIRNHPFYNIHSKLDTHSPVLASERLKELAGKAGLKEFSYRKLAMEFQPYYTDRYLDDVFNFFSQTPARPQPADLHFSTDQLKYNKSFWLTINAINIGKTATIDAQLRNNILTIKRANVLSYTLDLTKVPYKKNASLKIIDNGKMLLAKTIDKAKVTIRSKNFLDKKNSKNHKIEGPFAHVFLTSFIIVPGTIGKDKDNHKIKELVLTLCDDWEHRYFKKFKVKTDREITLSDIRSSNLVLIGSPQSNLMLQKLGDRLPLQVEDNFVSIGKRRLNGSDLSYYFVYPNPENLQKYIAVLGYNNPSNFAVWSEKSENMFFNNISDFGWYDYKIWNFGLKKKIISGYFNYDWK